MPLATKAKTDPRCFCVVVHDVTPVFSVEINQILKRLQPLVSNSLSAGVVPRWHGRLPDADDRRQFRTWAECFGEMLLHGWTHYREQSSGLVSWLTGRSDEFSGISSTAAKQRLTEAQSAMNDILEMPLRGFVPPAWQFPCQPSDIQPAGIEYIMGFQRLRMLNETAISLATWSWDWGWLYGTSRAGAWLGTGKSLCRPSAIPTIVIHPIDVHRNCVQHAEKMIQSLLRDGWKPVLPREIVESLRVGARS